MDVLVTLVVIVMTVLEIALKVALTLALILIGFATAIGILIYVLWKNNDDGPD